MTPVDVRIATDDDFPGFVTLAGQVEHWFGPMVAVAGFHTAVRKTIAAGTAVYAGTPREPLGGMLFGTDAATGRYQISWLVVADGARQLGVGTALLEFAYDHLVTRPATVQVVTFGADHPAVSAGARAFYLRHGFSPAEPAANGPEGGSRQWFRSRLD